MSRIFCRSAVNYDRKEASLENGLHCKDPSLTVQSQAEEADINTIVRNFGVTGLLPQNVRVPTFDDFSGIDDYRTAIETIREAEKSFLAMPSDVRRRFDDDPQKFVEYCSDSRNLEEMRKLGLAVPVVAQEVVQGQEAKP